MSEREFHVLVERELSGWVKVTATSPQEAIFAARRIPDDQLPVQRIRRECWKPQPLVPVTKYGRVLVLRAARTCGPGPDMLLYLDCGHQVYIEPDTWFPDNPYAECRNTTCPSRKAVAA